MVTNLSNLGENMRGNYNIFNRVFTKRFLKMCLEDKHIEILDVIVEQYFSTEKFKNNQDIISHIYSYMSFNYRNEYIYLNTLFNKLLLGRHSLNTTSAITQLPIEHSKADFILINGKAVVYEIKTELDSFERLVYQIDDYYKAFTHVNVITCEENYYKLYKMLKDTSVGICVLSKKNNVIQQKKSPIENFENISHKTIFKILRKFEYETIILDYFDRLPNCTQVKYYEECLNLFRTIPLKRVYDYFLKELKKRNKVLDVKKFKNIPYEMRSAVYFSNFNNAHYDKIDVFLNQNYEGD